MNIFWIWTIVWLQQIVDNNNKSKVEGFQISKRGSKRSHLISKHQQTSSQSQVFFAKIKNGDNLGELSVSKKLPKFDEQLINDASQILSWEQPNEDNEGEVICWKDGNMWRETRVELVRLWVLPRDMTNGSWEAYTLAANQGELRLLQKMPQLLRLPTELIIDSANTILKTLKLPPALLREEPILLSIPPFLLEKAFEKLLFECKSKMIEGKQISNDEDDLGIEYFSKTIKACRETPGLLAETAIRIFIDMN